MENLQMIERPSDIRKTKSKKSAKVQETEVIEVADFKLGDIVLVKSSTLFSPTKWTRIPTAEDFVSKTIKVSVQIRPCLQKYGAIA